MSSSAVSPRRRRVRFILKLLGGSLAGILLLLYFVFILPFWGIPFNQSRHGRVPLTPPWALECWLWEDDVNTAARVDELLAGYARYDFPVRTILIDSPWSERYNDFKVDESRYPNPEQYFHGLKDRGYRIVLWMTCMVDSYSKDTKVRQSGEFFEQAAARGYLAGGRQPVHWWKGAGGFIDYSNPEALRWWQGLQQQVLDWGVDGWKLDGCDTLFSSQLGPIPLPFRRVQHGWMSTRAYMDHYARDEYRNGLQHNPQFVTLIRALDQPWPHPEGFAPLDAAPVTWVGDNSHNWGYEHRGIKGAIRDILGSARLGYCVIGSDVAGYHGRSNPDDINQTTTALLASWAATNRLAGATNEFGTAADEEIAPNIYIRWAEFSSFCGLFLNGGHGERRMWKRSQPELEIVRKFSWLHTELLPYLYSHVVTCHNGGPPLMRPLADGDFHYRFGDDLLVAPIHEDRTERHITLPPGRWHYLFHDQETVTGPATISRNIPLDEYPVFVREGALIPLHVSRSYTGFGDRDSADFTTWLIYPAATGQFTMYHPGSHPQPKATTLSMTNTATGLVLKFDGEPDPHLLRIHAPSAPMRVKLDDRELPAGEAWSYDPADQRLVIKTRTYAQGHYDITWRP